MNDRLLNPVMVMARRYQKLLEFLPHGYLETDAAGVIHQANRAVATLFRVNQDQLIGQALIDFVAGGPMQRQSFANHLVQLTQVERLQNWNVRLQPTEGATFPASLTVGAVRGAGNQLVGLHWLLHVITEHQPVAEVRQDSIRDLELAYKQSIIYARELTLQVTKHRQAQEALRESEENYRSLLEAEHRRRQEVETLRDIAMLLTVSLDLDQVLENILVQLEQVVMFDSVCIFLLENGYLHAIAGRGFYDPSRVIGLDHPTDGILFHKLQHSRRPLILVNASEDPRFEHWGGTEHVRGWMAIPLLVHGEVIGYLALDSRQVATYGQVEADLAQAFANQAAIAIENARLHTKSARWAEQLTILNKAGRALASSLDLDNVLKQVVIEAMILVEAEGASLLLVEAEDEELIFVASISPASERLIGVRMSATAGIAGWAIQTKQSVLVDDVQNDPRFYQSIDTTTHLTTRTLIAVPLIVRDTVVGVIEVINKLTGSFDQSDLEVLQALGSSAAIAIENAHLFETTRHSQERYRDLFDNSPISIWEQNFSEVKMYLDRLRSGGVNDLDRYFRQHPSAVKKCTKMVKVTEVNQASLALYRASNKEELLIGIDTFFSRVTYDTFRTMLVALAAGQIPYECETVNLTLLGDKVHLWLKLSIAPEYGATWSRVLVSIMDITALKQAEGVMRKQRQDLHRLSIQLITTQEAERKHLAHELHDEMGQALTAIGLNLEVIEQELSPLATPGTKKRFIDTISLVDQTLAQIRELSLNLRPSMLDDLGLAATLGWYTKQYATRSNIEVELDTSDFEGRLKPEVEIALYRVAQEALTNVARHTQAQRVTLRLVRQEVAVTVLIEDNGCGFDVEEVANRRTSEPGLGLIGIRERVTALGGRFEVQSQPAHGTRLIVEIPLLM